MSDKTQRFIVEIVTSEEIVDDHGIDEMAQRIADAIVEGAIDFYICPRDSGVQPEIVYVKGWYSDKQIIEHIY